MDQLKVPKPEELRGLLSQAQFLEIIVAQINKDLGSQIEDIQIPEEGDKAEGIYTQLRKRLEELDRQPGNRIQDLVYRVDVPAKDFFNILQSPQDSLKGQYQAIADAILNREMKKVWFRLNYKG